MCLVIWVFELLRFLLVALFRLQASSWSGSWMAYKGQPES